MRIFSPRSSNDAMVGSSKNTNPWAGLASYEDPKAAEVHLTFYGRDEESYDLASLIKGNVVVTLYGKSGIGKTSLLNAGVFPELRITDYLPISIRLAYRENPTQNESLQSKIITAIENAADNIEEVEVLTPQCNQQALDYLWNYFARHRFYNNLGVEVTPVIVFDQFEEVFNSDHDDIEILLRQHDYINDRDHRLENYKVNGKTYTYQTNYRFVLAIREDDFYKLEDCIDNCLLPALKRGRYRLHGLSQKGAKDVILLPAKDKHIFNNNDADTIANRIIELSKASDKSINTLMLSLICYILYDNYATKGKEIELPDLEGYKDILEVHYLSLIGQIPVKQRIYIEDHLVDDQGRRKTIYLSDLRENAPEAEAFIKNTSSRLLTLSDGKVELVHDQLAAIIKSFHSQRFERQRVRFLTVSLLTYYIVVTYFIWHIALQTLKASWGVSNDESMIEYVQEFARDITINTPLWLIRGMVYSKICSCLILVYFISFEIPKNICKSFYSKLQTKELISLIIAILLLILLKSDWFFKLSDIRECGIISIACWGLLLISLVFYYKDNLRNGDKK